MKKAPKAAIAEVKPVMAADSFSACRWRVSASAVGISHVIVDGPPILGIADSIVLGNQIQDILFIVRAGTTRKANIRDALRRLRLSGLTPRGAVLTFAPARALQGYGSYYGYGPEPRARKTALPGRRS